MGEGRGVQMLGQRVTYVSAPAAEPWWRRWTWWSGLWRRWRADSTPDNTEAGRHAVLVQVQT